MGGLRLFAFLAITTTSCTSARTSVQAPVDVPIAAIASSPATRITENGHAASGTCTLRLSVNRIQKSSPGCYLDEHISEGPGLLNYPCEGSGSASATFGEQRYSGRIEQGDVHLELTTELDWEDGCRWGTSAVIEGRIPETGMLETLSWSYHDRVISGTNCTAVCTANASVDVTRTTPHSRTDDGRPSD